MVPSIPESKPPLVLVLDDDPETCVAVESALSPGFEVRTHPLSVLGTRIAPAPDLVVAPGSSALEVRMQPGWQDVPLLLIADGTAGAPRAALWRWSAQDYVARPLGAAELRARAANLVAMRRASLLLRRDLDCDEGDLELLALASVLRRQELSDALAAAQEAHERIDRASRTLTAYVRTVGHELSAPLSTLREGLARLRGADAAACAEVLPAFEAAVDWIAELSRGLVDHTKSQPPSGG